MKKKLIIGLVCISILLSSCASTKKGDEEIIVESYTVYDVVAKTDNYDIPATLYRPDIKGKVPLVIMIHGTGSQKDEAGNAFKIVADALAMQGIASLRFDFPGCGSSQESYRLYTNKNAIRDICDLAIAMGKESFVDSQKIGLLGWSQGGTDALLAAGKTSLFASVATWSASVDLTRMVTPEMREMAKEKGYAVLEFPWRSSLDLSQEWIEQADSMNVLDYVAQIECPLASFHGTRDETVPYSDSKRVQKALDNPENKLIPIKGADHTYGIFTDNKDQFEQLKKRTVKWFVNTLYET